MTQKQKLEQFDALLAERDTLRLAIYDLTCSNTAWPLTDKVLVDCGSDISQDYKGERYNVTRSNRAMPYYMVQELSGHGGTRSTTFVTENDLDAHRDDSRVFWRMLRHAAWKIQSRKAAA